MNFTISVPNGTTNHGNPQLLCLPSTWTDIVTFLVTNYYAHAATVLIEPGMASRRTLVVVLAALILPFSGISRAVHAICRHAATERKNTLKRAARSRALCMVMKVPRSGPYLRALRSVRMWGKPKEGATAETSLYPERLNDLATEGTPCTVKVHDVDSTEKRRIDKKSRSCWWEVAEGYEPIPKQSMVLGEYWLDEEYYLAYVPYYAELAFAQPPKESSADSPENTRQEITIPHSYSVVQALFGIAQALWTIVTIYQARGDQIQQYGFAAFGLTVVPYAFMSVVNAVTNLLTPQYATLFVIRTPAMTEAEQQGKAFFKAAFDVDLLKVPASAIPWEWTPVIRMYLPLLLGLVPLAIVGSLSKFQAGNSTSLQRGFTMAWLVLGIVYGCILHSTNPGADDPLEKNEKKQKMMMGKKNSKDKEEKHRSIKQYLIEDAACESSAPDMVVFIFTLAFSPPAIGGMVLVGLMIKEYGNCSSLG